MQREGQFSNSLVISCTTELTFKEKLHYGEASLCTPQKTSRLHALERSVTFLPNEQPINARRPEIGCQWTRWDWPKGIMSHRMMLTNLNLSSSSISYTLLVSLLFLRLLHTYLICLLGFGPTPSSEYIWSDTENQQPLDSDSLRMPGA